MPRLIGPPLTERTVIGSEFKYARDGVGKTGLSPSQHLVKHGSMPMTKNRRPRKG